jgi:hypothetical protein
MHSIMKTRSMTKRENANKEYEVNIDFDEASEAWKANKKSTGGGCYKYICEAIRTNGKKCRKNPMAGCKFCSIHNK